MTRFLVTGASGLLGLNFALQYCQTDQVVGVTNRHPLTGAPFQTVQTDLLQPGEVERLLDLHRPEVVLHAAALALPDQCERQPELCDRLNAWLPGRIAVACRDRGIALVHISTDSVFDGQVGNYSEADPPNPLNAYARGKLAAERRVSAVNPDALIARVVFYGWSLTGQRSLGEFFYYNLQTGRPVRGFTDALFSPLLVTDLARILHRMVHKRLSGLYHVFSSQPVSKYDFGVSLARRFGLDSDLITPALLDEGGLGAARARNLSMDVSRLEQALGEKLPDQSAGLQRFFEQHARGLPSRLRQMAV